MRSQETKGSGAAAAPDGHGALTDEVPGRCSPPQGRGSRLGSEREGPEPHGLQGQRGAETCRAEPHWAVTGTVVSGRPGQCHTEVCDTEICTKPYRAVPYRAVLCWAILCLHQSVSYKAVLYRTVPYRNTEFRTGPYGAVPGRAGRAAAPLAQSAGAVRPGRAVAANRGGSAAEPRRGRSR